MAPAVEASARRGRWSALVVLGVGAILFLEASWRDAPRRTDRLDVYVIPPGTAERVADGVSIDAVLPRRLETSVGAHLEVINEDTVSHVFGPFVLAPGQRWSQRYGLAGEYAVACSLYPDVDLVIAVEPADASVGMSRLAYGGWTLMWAGMAAAMAGGCAFALGGWGGDDGGRRDTDRSLDIGGQPVSVGPVATPTVPTALHVGAWMIVTATIVLVALEALALSRLAPWRSVLASRALPLWIAAAALSFVAPVLVSVGRDGRLARTALLLLPVVLFLVVAIGLAPALGVVAIGWALVVVGAGFVLAAVVATARTSGLEDEASAIGRLALCGVGLVLVGIPWPHDTPPWMAARGAVALAVGTAVGWSVRAPRIGLRPGLRVLVGLGAASALVLGAGLLFVAVLAHIEAVTVPTFGNPVPADGASITRGRVLWNAHCAECHRPDDDLALGTDRALLHLITGGHDEAPGLAYTLPLDARGDLVNYLRDRFDGP